jgi:hypothetical protein
MEGMFFFFEHGSRFHYSSTGAKSLATNTWMQAGIESLTDINLL